MQTCLNVFIGQGFLLECARRKRRKIMKNNASNKATKENKVEKKAPEKKVEKVIEKTVEKAAPKSEQVIETMKAECTKLGLKYTVTKKNRIMATIVKGEKSFTVKVSPYLKAESSVRVRSSKDLVEFLNLSEKDYELHEKWPKPYELKMSLEELTKKVKAVKEVTKK